MDKVKINNQIVSMRKFVMQAKSHLINKFCREIKLLQQKKGKEEQVKKYKRKAERLSDAVSFIKTIKLSDISKKALCKEKNWQEVLKQKNIPFEDRCIALLANFKSVQTAVEKFYMSNIHLVPKIPILLKEMENRIPSMHKKIKSQNSGSQKECQKKLVTNSYEDNIKFESMLTTNSSSSPKATVKCVKDIKLKKKQPKMKTKAKNQLSAIIKPHKLNFNEEKCKQEHTSKLDIEEKEIYPSNNKDYVATEDEVKDCNEILKQTNEAGSKQEVFCSKLSNSIDSSDDDESDELAKNKFDHTLNANSDNDESDNLMENNIGHTLNDNSDDQMEYSSEEDNQNEIFMSKTSSISMHNIQQSSKNQGDFGLNRYSAKSSIELGFKSSGAKAVTLLNLNELEGLDEIPIESSEKAEEVEIEPISKHKKDSFFLNYGTISESSEESETEKDFTNKSGYNRKEKSDRYGGNNKLAKQYIRQFFTEKKNLSKEENEYNAFRSKFPGSEVNERKSAFSNKLFKKKSFSKSDQFQRKKSNDEFHRNKDVKTDKQNVNFKTSRKHSEHLKSMTSKPAKSGKTLDTDKPLHPSWEAKRKLKNSTPAKFQGKRIVFND